MVRKSRRSRSGETRGLRETQRPIEPERELKEVWTDWRHDLRRNEAISGENQWGLLVVFREAFKGNFREIL
jgi:hypothetical protein